MQRYRHFNSTMVRLKAASGVITAGTDVFQFHYGTIKSTESEGVRLIARKFQFHYGTIKRR